MLEGTQGKFRKNQHLPLLRLRQGLNECDILPHDRMHQELPEWQVQAFPVDGFREDALYSMAKIQSILNILSEQARIDTKVLRLHGRIRKSERVGCLKFLF